MGGVFISTKEIKVFYSWQSDLPGNKSRYIIQESIENAVKVLRDTIKVEADRDTKNEYGSPDIVQTIFSKIDECDLFIADVSVVNKYTSLSEDSDISKYLVDQDDIRLTPNPNVLVELGYAAKTLGWDRVICIINTDFGEIEKLPFDIAHRRLTPFSLNGKSKAEVKKELTGIIVDTITNLILSGNLKKSKGNFSTHIVGYYDFKTEKVLTNFPAISVKKLNSYNNLKESILAECKGLVDEISKIELSSPEDQKCQVIEKARLEPDPKKQLLPLQENLISSKGRVLIESLFKPQLFNLKEEDKKDIKERVNNYFGIDLDEHFFCFGNLTSVPNKNFQGSTFEGTEDEKRKHDKFITLQYKFLILHLFEQYVNTFNDLILIPLVITNDSTINDKDISVLIKIDTNTAEIIVPSSTLFNDEISGLEGIVYENNFIEQLFTLPENDKIQYDSDLSFDAMEQIRRMQKTNIWGQTQYDSQDYEIELQKYIAKPIEYDNSVFEYEIRNLRPKETKWLGASILVKPLSNSIKLSYSIKSPNSNGELAGDIVVEVLPGEKSEFEK